MHLSAKSGILSELDIILDHDMFTSRLEKLHELYDLGQYNRGGIIPLLGPTRCGKTEVAKRLMRETSSDADQKIVLGKIQPKPSDRDLFGAILKALGLHFGTKERTALMRDRACRAIRDRGLRMMILDECNHCAETGANLSHRSATDHFKSLVDDTGIVLVMCGLPNFERLIAGNEQFRDRAFGTVYFKPYDWRFREHRQSFHDAVVHVLELIETHGIHLDLDEDEITRRLYCLSGGRIGMMVRVLVHTIHALRKPVIELKSLRQGAKLALQANANIEGGTGEKVPGDTTLAASYVSIMTEAGLSVDIHSHEELEAATR